MNNENDYHYFICILQPKVELCRHQQTKLKKFRLVFYGSGRRTSVEEEFEEEKEERNSADSVSSHILPYFPSFDELDFSSLEQNNLKIPNKKYPL